MHGKTVRRILLASLVLAALCAAMRSHADDFYPPPADCPPGDRNDWEPKRVAHVPDRIEWFVLSPEAFSFYCPIGKDDSAAPAACAYDAVPDSMNGGYYARVYALAPRWTYPEALVHHEECHPMGWKHGGNHSPGAMFRH